jgi:cyclophilin family peptidyl-prolyl cis-trans isomerase
VLLAGWASGAALAQDPGEGTGPDSALAPAADRPRVGITVQVEAEDGKKTSLGTITIELFPEAAPQHVANFLKLVEDKFYVGTTFHRIVPAFVVQGGDLVSKRNWKSTRVGTGSDGPEYTVPAEISRKHARGAVAMARTQDAVNPNRESSPTQFYICLADLPALDRMGYSVFGQVVDGMDVVDKIARVKNTGGSKNQALQKIEMTDVFLVK